MIRKNGTMLGFFLLSLSLIASGTANSSNPTITLRGQRMGAVTFNHEAHMGEKSGCTVCHHSSKPERPSTAEFEKCGSCHLEKALPPVTTNWMNAFHNTTATKGVCIDCHKAAEKEGKAAPVQCKQCHGGRGK